MLASRSSTLRSSAAKYALTGPRLASSPKTVPMSAGSSTGGGRRATRRRKNAAGDSRSIANLCGDTCLKSARTAQRAKPGTAGLLQDYCPGSLSAGELRLRSPVALGNEFQHSGDGRRRHQRLRLQPCERRPGRGAAALTSIIMNLSLLKTLTWATVAAAIGSALALAAVEPAPEFPFAARPHSRPPTQVGQAGTPPGAQAAASSPGSMAAGRRAGV